MIIMDALKVLEEENCTEFQLMVVEWEQFNVIITVFCVNKTLLLVQRILWLSVPLPSLGILYGDKMPILRSHQIAITTNPMDVVQCVVSKYDPNNNNNKCNQIHVNCISNTI